MIIIFPAFFLFLQCGKNAPDCFQAAGDLVTEEVVVSSFDKITVFENINLVVKQGPAQKVEVETGENLLAEVSAVVEGDRLLLRNANGCNLFREYSTTTVTVTSPNITEIRSSTGLPIRSEGILAYPELSLYSESFNEPETETTDGYFDLELDVNALNVVVNGIAYFNLRGNAEQVNLNIAAGDSRIEAQNLLANLVQINHRGSNDMLIAPQTSLRGTIRGTGDVICFTRPPEVDITQLFNGRLIYRD